MPFLSCAVILICVPQDASKPAPPFTPELPALRVLREHKGDVAGAGFGHGLAFLGDIDRDGMLDYAMGAPREPSRDDSDGNVAVHSCKTGKLLYLHRGLGHGSGFGFAIAGGDCDGDGIADVAVGAPYASDKDNAHAGNVQFFSGKDGRLLREVWGAAEGEAFGWSLTAIGDVDKDGATDYAIGAPYADRVRTGKEPARDTGRVVVYSGKKARVLYTLWGEAAEDRFGWCTAPVDDCNTDGTPDLVIGAEGATQGNERPGSATLVSGKTGDSLVRLLGESGTYFGTAVCSLGDLDGDKAIELAIGAWNAGDDDGLRTGEVRIHSSRGGKPRHVLRGRAHLDQFGRALARVSDLDGDGVDELVVGAPSTETGGYVQVVSGKTFTVLAELRGSFTAERYGATLRTGDFDGDGTTEILIGVGLTDAAASTAGRVLLVGRERSDKPGK
jgi:hypothetical protein